MNNVSHNTPRPTSPHIGIYRKQITSVLSILHRLTGVALYFGAILLVVFLVAISYYPKGNGGFNFGELHNLLASCLGQTLLFGWSFAFFFHLLNGIRHLFWDMGKGFEITSINKTGWLVVVFSILLNLLTWVVAYLKMGILSL
jgi:succinate dehydrogenase / fumarate reductase cytochrome b subunit